MGKELKEKMEQKALAEIDKIDYEDEGSEERVRMIDGSVKLSKTVAEMEEKESSKRLQIAQMILTGATFVVGVIAALGSLNETMIFEQTNVPGSKAWQKANSWTSKLFK